VASHVRHASIPATVLTARGLRASTNWVGKRAALSVTPRTRFLREQRRRVVARPLPTLAMLSTRAPGPRWLAAAFEE